MRVDELREFGVSEAVIQKLEELGFINLTKIQEEAVKKGLFEGKNLVVSAPTNTGKTFIGELAALTASKRREKKRTFYLTPLKAIAEEKFEEFKKKYSDWGLNIAITTSERTEFDSNLIDYDLIIATYEKLSALLIKDSNLIRDIGVVIVDELQTISDENRGVNLEILLTRLISTDDPPQVIALSATTPNASELAEWLNAELVETEYREVELREGIVYVGRTPSKFKDNILEAGDFIYREFNSGNIGVEKDLGVHTFKGLIELCKEEQVIIFCKTKKDAEDLALNFSKHLPPSKSITKWIGDLDALVESTPSTRALKKCMMNGVAFHHAGLLPEERRIVEQAFGSGDIRIICSTPTLGAGVNTPAKTVIIRSTRLWNGRSIKSRDYKNMAGRAGRIKYHDSFGRSVLFAKTEKELEELWEGYINAGPERVESQIPKQDNIESSILSLVASGICRNLDELIKFIENTFFGYTYYRNSSTEFRNTFQDNIEKQIRNLCKMGFLREEDGALKVTELGKRCAEELLSPRSVYLIYQSFKKFEDEIKSREDYEDLIEPILHLACCTPDASLLYKPKYDQEKKELWIYWDANKDKYLISLDDEETILRSVKTTQMLLRWIEGVPYSDMKGFAPQGIVKSMGETISWIIKGMARIAERPLFNFPDDFIRFLNILSERVNFGVRENAIELMKLRIPAIHRHRAMLLADAGYGTLKSLIKADINELKEVPGIGDKLSIRIKEYIEQFIGDDNERKYQYYLRRAKELGRDTSIIEKLFKETGDNFSRVCAELIQQLGIPCQFIGDVTTHVPDCLIEINDKKIVIECKRKKGNELVSAVEAEEIKGKGAKYKPIAEVTIGYPDFSEEAINNVEETKITLITHTALAEILIGFWEGRITKEEILEIFKSGVYLTDENIKKHLSVQP